MRRAAFPSIALAAWLAAACASTPPGPSPSPEWSSRQQAMAAVLHERLAQHAPEPGAVVVRLAFPSGADLDLYVTDPRLETVYYANTPAVSGGRLLVDQRCDSSATDGVRVEEVRFDAPLAGRYRIGVDYPHRCDRPPDPAPFVVSVDVGLERKRLEGLVRWLEFETVLHEFDVEREEAIR